jgi:hypothetical protein
MTTPRTRVVVSLAATLTFTLVLGACAGASRSELEGPQPVTAGSATIRFENEGREHVHVYLVTERREWLLGRVEPGVITTLRVPPASLDENSRFVRLAVLAGQPVSLRAARDPRAALTITQPVSALLLHRWMFAQGQLTSMRR